MTNLRHLSPPDFAADYWRAWAVFYMRVGEMCLRTGRHAAANCARLGAEYCFDKANEAVLNPDLRAAP